MDIFSRCLSDEIVYAFVVVLDRATGVTQLLPATLLIAILLPVFLLIL